MTDDEATVEFDTVSPETVALEAEAQGTPAPAAVTAVVPTAAKAPDHAKGAPTQWDFAVRRMRKQKRMRMTIVTMVIVAVAAIVIVARLLAG